MQILQLLGALIFLLFGLALRKGKLLFLIAGNNNARKPYNQQSKLAGRYVGIIMYGAAIALLLVYLVPNLPDSFWIFITIFFILFMIGITYLFYKNSNLRK
ncbi:DUF3784 domain-containing protein [Lactiplantibacillus modestisalitolerans]|nr:DUF3784 domain-containing protein [Lactiplantibacillus modestisalitolerans]